MSKYSPGIIGGEERLARFIFSPMHTNSRGVVKPSLFEHVHSRGCSIQRDSIAKDVEINAFVTNFLIAGNGRYSWLGVVSAKCSDVRDIRIDTDTDRFMCVFDTAEPSNPSHGEICRARVVDEADRVELRHSLWKAFNGGAIVKPSDYRLGQIGDRTPH